MINLNDVLCEDNRAFTDEEIDRLAASIGNVGLLQPIVLLRADVQDKKWRVIAGRRRYRALMKLERYEIEDSDVRIIDTDDPELISFVENHERKNLSQTEEIKQVAAMREKYSPADLAILLGRSEKYVRIRLQLAFLTQFFLEQLEQDAIPSWKHSHYLLISRFSHDIQERIRKNLQSYCPASLTDLEKYLNREYSTLLIFAKFDTAGCASCPDRSDANDLFPELRSDEDVCCLNQDCFKQKKKHAVKEKIEHIKAEKKAIVPIAPEPDAPKDARVKALSPDQFDIVERDVQEDQANAIIVNGADAGTYCRIADKRAAASAAVPAQKTDEELRLDLLHRRQKLATAKFAEYLRTNMVLRCPSDNVLLFLTVVCPIAPDTFDKIFTITDFKDISFGRVRVELWNYFLRYFREHAERVSRMKPENVDISFEVVSSEICGLSFDDFMTEAEKELPKLGKQEHFD